jgi:hypothetical protein
MVGSGERGPFKEPKVYFGSTVVGTNRVIHGL